MATAAPSTPPRRRLVRLSKSQSAVTPQAPMRQAMGAFGCAPKRKLSNAAEDGEAKRLCGDGALPICGDRDEVALAAIVEEFGADFDRHAMPMETRRLLAPIIQRWGKARLPQVLGLWTFLGDGTLRPVSASSLQVWGPPGTGKTAVVSDYLNSLEIRHVRLNCATFTSLAELNSRLIELLRRIAVDVQGEDVLVSELPSALHRRVPMGQQVRSLDKLETMVRVPLQTLAKSSDLTGSPEAGAQVKVVVMVDNVQELPRLGASAIDSIINLPEVLQWGNQLAVVAVGRLRLSSLGLHTNREPPAVAFQTYTLVEAEAALNKVLLAEHEKYALGSNLPIADVCSGLMKFAWPHLGLNLQQLLNVGRQLLREGLPKDVAGGACGAAFQQQVLKAVQQRLGICDLTGLMKSEKTIEGMDTASVSAMLNVRQMTKAEMRLILAAYLAGYVEKDDDVQLFMPGMKRKAKRKASAKASQSELLPVYTRAPRPTSMSRLFAVYHRLARRPQLLGPTLYEHLASLKEMGLLQFPAERVCFDTEVKVTCRAQLALVRAIATELNVDLAEYLTKY